jgi:hypothetical protein
MKPWRAPCGLGPLRTRINPETAIQMRLGERIGADPWIDITQREIGRREKTIAVYEALFGQIAC